MMIVFLCILIHGHEPDHNDFIHGLNWKLVYHPTVNQHYEKKKTALQACELWATLQLNAIFLAIIYAEQDAKKPIAI